MSSAVLNPTEDAGLHIILHHLTSVARLFSAEKECSRRAILLGSVSAEWICGQGNSGHASHHSPSRRRASSLPATLASDCAGVAQSISTNRPSITAMTRAYGNLPPLRLLMLVRSAGRLTSKSLSGPSLALDAVADCTGIQIFGFAITHPLAGRSVGNGEPDEQHCHDLFHRPIRSNSQGSKTETATAGTP